MHLIEGPEPHAPPATLCGAKTRGARGRRACRNPAGFRTGHLGTGPCFLHGGLSPVKHGRYSTIKRGTLATLIAEHEADPNPLDVLPELAALRALFHDWVERYDFWRDALLAWHASWRDVYRTPERYTLALASCVDELDALLGDREAEEGAEGAEPGGAVSRQREDIAAAREFLAKLGAADAEKPREILDITDARGTLDAIGRMAERVEKARAANAIGRPALYALMTEMGRVVETYVRDEAVQEKIRAGWLAIRVERIA